MPTMPSLLIPVGTSIKTDYTIRPYRADLIFGFSAAAGCFCRSLHAFEGGFTPFSGHSLHFGRTDPVERKHLVPDQHLDPLEVVGKVHQTHTHLRTRSTDGA